MVDTGARFSALCEKDARLIGLDPDSLPEAKGGGIGFGGLFKPKMINRLVTLTFRSGEDEHTTKYSSGFRVVTAPPNISREEREKILRYTPSVLGMDVLSKFETRVTKNEVELILEERGEG